MQLGLFLNNSIVTNEKRVLRGAMANQCAIFCRPGTVYDHILEKIFKKQFLTKISNPYGNFKRYYPDFFQIQFGLTQPGTVEVSGKIIQ